MPRFNGRTLLWLDFSVDDEGAYQYRLSEKLDYTVTVKKNLSISYDDHTFDNCICLSFDAPDLVDEEIAHVFAPHVGPVQILGAWASNYLAAWELP